ncbi:MULTISPECIES: 4-hydroxythreonine-4-phosphate dehydrogenase PdxA [Thalassospira]|uniref:4-hydroxythreonine-4-phosphate dehydrogenase n=2 Tax=Thalassospira TaxID=168934 RepID=A0A367W227_9PROT|nr:MULTISPECIES: 4-hydroxythreonine-4-phosphate dehydrogenase PdxA [Thalassospira]MDG4721238.1 4-hydroxythreonine-4-phosphate dehydrogenase PdxA [Thalassospira sp. FZY0004]RCK33660.1 4-hydroxythreonine-4-phosphate dehydrogenase [Thalassospira profundimaris]
MTKIAPIALTIGEPGGVGPELALKAWLKRKEQNLAPFCVLSPITILTRAAEQLGQDIQIKVVSDISETSRIFDDALPVLALDAGDSPPVCGVASAATADIVIESITKAVKLCEAGNASAVVTNPIQKSALYAAGFRHPGHTEFLAELAGPGTVPVMMLANAKLRVVPLTIHIALTEVPKQLTPELIMEQCQITAAALQRDFGVEHPRLALAGLNPHAGEDGTMGTEEQTIMMPAINALRAKGLNVIGPMPADTMFHDEARENYDVALCPYHDQALIPVKTLDFHGGVNVTLGLPFIRTSPDHGTALNIAGKGIARPDSLIAALKMAAEMATKRLATGA